MDTDRITAVIRAVASAPSRRRVAAGLAGGVLGALSLVSAGDPVRAKKGKKRCRCRPKCSGKVCGDNGCGDSCGSCAGNQPFCCNGGCRAECCADGQCATGEACFRGACVVRCANDVGCPASAGACCGGACVDTNTNRDNCGACGAFCVAPGTCELGQCGAG